MHWSIHSLSSILYFITLEENSFKAAILSKILLTEIFVKSDFKIGHCDFRRCQEKSYPGEIVPKRNRTQHEWVRFLWKNRTLGTISPEISYPGYHFSRDIVPYFNNVALSYLVH